MKKKGSESVAVLTLHGSEIELFPTVAIDYATQKSVIEGKSDKTVCEYLSDLRMFFRYLIATEKTLTISSGIRSFRSRNAVATANDSTNPKIAIPI